MREEDVKSGVKQQSKLRSSCELPIKKEMSGNGSFWSKLLLPCLEGIKMKENNFKASLTILASADQGTFLLHPGRHLLL